MYKFETISDILAQKDANITHSNFSSNYSAIS